MRDRVRAHLFLLARPFCFFFVFYIFFFFRFLFLLQQRRVKRGPPLQHLRTTKLPWSLIAAMQVSRAKATSSIEQRGQTELEASINHAPTYTDCRMKKVDGKARKRGAVFFLYTSHRSGCFRH